MRDLAAILFSNWKFLSFGIAFYFIVFIGHLVVTEVEQSGYSVWKINKFWTKNDRECFITLNKTYILQHQ